MSEPQEPSSVRAKIYDREYALRTSGDPEQLKQVYSEIYGTLGCPKTRYAWPGVWP